MTLKNTLKNYFNSGSPDKVSKRRIAGLVIAITAVALIAALLVLTVSSIASAITNKKTNAAEEGAPVSIAVETVSGSVDDINANLNSKVTLVDIGGTTIAQGDVKTLVQTNRTNLGTAEEPIYAYGNNYPASDALLIEAFTAFDKMACDFYNEAGNYKIFVSKVYNVSMQVNAAYANGLTVKLGESVLKGAVDPESIELSAAKRVPISNAVTVCIGVLLTHSGGRAEPAAEYESGVRVGGNLKLECAFISDLSGSGACRSAFAEIKLNVIFLCGKVKQKRSL